jgi:Transglutaminase-like superfamily
MRRVLAAAEAAAWLALAVIVLRIVAFARLFRELPPGSPGPVLTDEDRVRVDWIRGLVNGVAKRFPWRPGCLPLALAAACMCRVRGLRIPIALSVASRRNLVAHARLDPSSDAELALTTPEGRTHLGRVMLKI